MAITSSAVCNTFKNQLLSGTHDFDQTSGDIFKVAMYISTATIGKSTTDYLSAGETSGTKLSSCRSEVIPVSANLIAQSS